MHGATGSALNKNLCSGSTSDGRLLVTGAFPFITCQRCRDIIMRDPMLRDRYKVIEYFSELLSKE